MHRWEIVHACYLCEMRKQKNGRKKTKTLFSCLRVPFHGFILGKKVSVSDYVRLSPAAHRKKLLDQCLHAQRIFICLELSMWVSHTAKCIPFKEPCVCVCVCVFLLGQRECKIRRGSDRWEEECYERMKGGDWCPALSQGPHPWFLSHTHCSQQMNSRGSEVAHRK